MLGCPPAEADDLTQETMVVLLRQNTPPTKLRPFLRSTAKNLFLGALRKQRREPVTQAWIDKVDDAWGRQAEQGSDWLQALAACREHLTPKQRRGLALYYGQERSLADAAREMGLRTNGLKTLLQRARAQLKTCIERKIP